MKRVLITGASSGLGEGLALAYAEPGAVIGLVARRAEKLSQVAEKVRAKGARALILLADVVDTQAMQGAIDEFVREAEGIDIVIANAGIGEGRKGLRCDAGAAAQVLNTNIIGLSNTLLPCVNVMREQGSGTLVGMASVAGYRAIPGSLSYSASKAAVMTFMEGLQMETDGSGVHAVTLCPGFVRTAITDKNEFKMPFLLELDDACARMKCAIDAKKSRYTFPAPMFVAAQLMRIAPQWILKRSSPRWRDRQRKK
jgi:short-subunit dehydrogenase